MRKKVCVFRYCGAMFLQDRLPVVVQVAITETFDSSGLLGVVWREKAKEIVGQGSQYSVRVLRL